MGVLSRLAALILGGDGEACPHCGRRASVITRDEPDPEQSETWPVLVCRRHGIVGAIRP